MSAPPSKHGPPSAARERCFCGAPQALELEYYCSVKCAREDALNALTRGAPHTSDRPPTPPLPTLPPDFFKPPIIGRGFTPSSGSDEGFLHHADLGPFAPWHPKSKPEAIEAIVPRANGSKPGPGPASGSSTRSSGPDQSQWKSHYRLLLEKESPHSIPDVIRQAFQVASASTTTDNPIRTSSISMSSKGKLTQKMVTDALRGSFGQPAPTAADSLPLQNPRTSQSILSSTRVCSTSRQKSTRISSTSALFPLFPPGINWATPSSASRHRTLGSAFGRSEPSLNSVRSSTIEFDNTAPLEHPLPRHPLKGGAARLFLPLRRIGSQYSLSSQNLQQRLPHKTDVDSPPFTPTPATATQASTRLGVVVRQNVLLTKRRLPIGGGPTKLSTGSKPGHSRADRVPLFLQLPVRESEVSKLPPSSAIEIEVEDPPASNVNLERSFVSSGHRTVASAFPRTPSSNSLSPDVPSVSFTPRLNLCASLLLETPETTVRTAYGDGREMDDASSPSTSECPVTPEDSAFTLGDSQLHPRAPVERCRSERSMRGSDAAITNLHRRFEGGMVLDDEVTPIGEKTFAQPHL